MRSFQSAALVLGSLCLLTWIPGGARADSTFTQVCVGDGGDQLGCMDCPCDNNAAVGSGSGCLNSTGLGAILLASGTASITDDSLRFEAIQVEPGGAAILMSAASILPLSPAHSCFGTNSGIQSITFDGLRCLGGFNRRHGIRGVNAAGEIGTHSSNNGWGPPDNPDGGLLLQGGFAIGETHTFQMIYRTPPVQMCGTALNTTQGISVTIEP